MLPPVLEIYVLSHPGDGVGADIGQSLLQHFRGSAFSGLIGGAVDVYFRSESNGDPGGPPRPIPAIEPLPYDIPGPALTAVVIVAGDELANAVAKDDRWHGYVQSLVGARKASPTSFGVLLVGVSSHALSDTKLANLVGGIQEVAADAYKTDEFMGSLTRDVSQAIAQLADPQAGRLSVFISHTKRMSVVEQPSVAALVALIRKVIGETRLNDFFDANDLQPNEDWAPALIAAAASGAMLAVRTDLYSSRSWCQREILTAKRHGMPVVVLDALTHGEKRGSFLMDHVPRTPCRKVDGLWEPDDVVRVLGQLVDECLKRALWGWQQRLAVVDGTLGVDWWAPHAPEPATFLNWLEAQSDLAAHGDEPLTVLHPDPPLGEDEVVVLAQIAHAAGLADGIKFLTPRGLAVRGG